MTVQKLISELKKMPPRLQVYYAHHDNSKWEIAGEVFYLSHCVKEDLREVSGIVTPSQEDKDNFERLPEQWVMIRG